MAILPNGLETIERGSTTWRLIINQNFAKLATNNVLDDYYTKTESDDRYYTKDDVYTKTESDDRYYTQNYIDNTFYTKDDVYTKTESDDRYYTKSYIDDNYYTTDDVYTKTECDDKFCLKEDCNTIASSASLLTLNSDWDNYGSPYRDLSVLALKNDGVMVTGTVKQTGSSSTIATLPAGYRPSKSLSFPVVTESSGMGSSIDFGAITIQDDGDIILETGSTDRVSIEVVFVK